MSSVIVKFSGLERPFTGPARVFEGEEAMLTALSDDPQSFKVYMKRIFKELWFLNKFP